jgi:hypothetical protein
MENIGFKVFDIDTIFINAKLMGIDFIFCNQELPIVCPLEGTINYMDEK